MPSELWDFLTINESIHHFFGADIVEFSREELGTKEWLRQAIMEIVEKRAAAKEE